LRDAARENVRWRTAALHSTLDHYGSDVISMASYLTVLSDTIKNSFGDWIFQAHQILGENSSLEQSLAADRRARTS
jgi:formyltetrahydrofolate hydrolase